MPYKNPDSQRAYQANWLADRRREWLGRQRCSLCGGKENLRVFRHIGAGKLNWTRQGPSHRLFRVVCGDASECLRRRAMGPIPKKPRAKAKPKAPRRKPGRPKMDDGLTYYERRKRKEMTPADIKKRVAEQAAADAGPPPSKLQREIDKPDRRPRCPEHGARGTTVFDDSLRFVCCGTAVAVPNAPAPTKAHKWA